MDSFFASLMFFTRLPWWRLRSVPKEAFEHVVDWWPLIGWLTGGVMSAVFLAASLLGFAPAVAALLAISARLLLTGALHEDGLADFCDGFGGGSTRERTLFIMKDSHIGTYGVLGLIFGLGLLGASVADVSEFAYSCWTDMIFDPDVDAYLRWASLLLLFMSRPSAPLLSSPVSCLMRVRPRVPRIRSYMWDVRCRDGCGTGFAAWSPSPCRSCSVCSSGCLMSSFSFPFPSSSNTC